MKFIGFWQASKEFLIPHGGQKPNLTIYIYTHRELKRFYYIFYFLSG